LPLHPPSARSPILSACRLHHRPHRPHRTHRTHRPHRTHRQVYAYYNKDKSGADTGTVLRFIQRDGTYGPAAGFSNPEGVLPGFEGVAYQFDGTSIPAYSDHWVSNVIDRNGFLDTLNDTLGFTPKVDFNAGVVAAGEAVIESTVTGNTSKHLSTTTTEVLKNQTQVYLPINNAISPVGHVYGYLEEIGQGVQHIASRVEDLQGFIERVNNYRSITGRGFTFLNIPRSYYGRCSAELLVKEAGLGAKDADAAFAALVAAGICTKAGVTDLDVTDAAITKAVKSVKACGGAAASKVGAAVKLGRYNNLYTLLRDNVTEQDYLQIVRNKILVDIQGEDILYQIFTSCVLQRGATEEAPFLEFIQRVCADCRGLDGNCRTDKPIKPGCGGFGIRNFLTLFLSIELSKAMRECDDAAASGQTKNMEYAEKQISILTHQLDESNPVLTMISDAMTAEGACVEELAAIATDLSAAANKRRKVLNAEVEKQQAQKEAGNQKLQDVSQRHKDQMSAIREAHLK
jgi:4-hydroxyphenylpyruvate dioxygenase-like putative hemolysin